MRRIVTDKLRELWPGARIVHELPTRYSGNSIDLAAITQTELVCVEIKSSKDTMDRLEGQLRAFLPIATHLIAALAPKWNEALPSKKEAGKRGGTLYTPHYTEAQQIIRRVGGHAIETWTVSAEEGAIKDFYGGAWRRPALPWTVRLLDILHVEELKTVAARKGLPFRPRSNHTYLRDLCADYLTGREALRAVCGALRARPGFAAESDPPVQAGHQPSAAAVLV